MRRALAWLNLYGREAVQHKLKNSLKTKKMPFLPFFELMSDSLTTIYFCNRMVFFRILEKTSSELICTLLYLLCKCQTNILPSYTKKYIPTYIRFKKVKPTLFWSRMSRNDFLLDSFQTSCCFLNIINELFQMLHCLGHCAPPFFCLQFQKIVWMSYKQGKKIYKQHPLIFMWIETSIKNT